MQFQLYLLENVTLFNLYNTSCYVLWSQYKLQILYKSINFKITLISWVGVCNNLLLGTAMGSSKTKSKILQKNCKNSVKFKGNELIEHIVQQNVKVKKQNVFLCCLFIALPLYIISQVYADAFIITAVVTYHDWL